MKDSEHLQWIHDRIVDVYHENENVDFLIRMREIIQTIDTQEKSFEAYLEFVKNKRNKKC